MSPLSLSPNLYRDVAHAMRTKDKANNMVLNRGSSRRELARPDIYTINYIDNKNNININNYIYMKDILNKALTANADTDAVAKVINTVVNTPCQDAQSKTDKEVAIKRSLAVKEALAKRYKALRLAVANIISDAILGDIDTVSATDDIIKLVTAGRIIDIEDYIWSAKTVHKLDYNADSVANTDANYIINVDAAAKGKDKSDRRVFRKDANGRIIELRGVNNDAPDELY